MTASKHAMLMAMTRERNSWQYKAELAEQALAEAMKNRSTMNFVKIAKANDGLNQALIDERKQNKILAGMLRETIPAIEGQTPNSKQWADLYLRVMDVLKDGR